MKLVYKLSVLLGLCVLVLLVRSYTNYDGFTNTTLKTIPHHIPASAKASYESIIPRKVYMSWKTREIPPLMYETIMNNVKENPEFDFYIFDDSECRDFILANYDEETANAFNALIPGAYKSDLWRYCIINKLGGIYMDIKFKIITPLNTLLESQKTRLIKDVNHENHIYQGILIAKPGEPLINECINKVKMHVKTKFYGDHPHHPTGPKLVGEIVNSYNMQNSVDLEVVSIPTAESPYRIKIVDRNMPDITYFTDYNEYRIEQKSLQKSEEHYHAYWNNRNMYKD